MRFLIYTFAVILFIIISLPSLAQPASKPLVRLNAQSQGEGLTERIYFYSPSGDIEKLLTLRKLLIERGARRVNCFLPFTVVGDLPGEVEFQQDLAGSDIVASYENHIPPEQPGALVSSPQWVQKCYQIAQPEPGFPIAPATNFSGFNTFGMLPAGQDQTPAKQFSFSRSEQAGQRIYNQNSEFMLGDILVQLVFPESIGNDENWTDGAMSTAAAQVTQVLLYYQYLYSYTDIRFIVRNLPRVVTSTEPINFPRESQKDWITDVMNTLGYAGTTSQYVNLVHQFNDEWRIKLGTDWVFTAFVVNAARDFDHLFPNARYYGFSKIGGPHLALPYPTGEFGNVFTQVFKHELARIFWAHYESVTPETNCNSWSGYLNGRNWNKTLQYTKGDPVGCSNYYTPITCIMNIVDMTELFYNGPPCDHTLKMMGISDDNLNNIPDVVDIPPVIQFETARRETIQTDFFDFRFQSISEGIPNTNPLQDPARRITYALPIKDVSYNINGVGPIRLTPEDGVSDETTEDFYTRINTLLPGLTEIEVMSRNTMGATSAWKKKYVFYVGLSYKQVKFIQSNEGINIGWYMLGETFGARFDLHRVDLSSGQDNIIVSDIQPSAPPDGYFLPFSTFDSDVIPGQEYRYYIEGSFPFTYRGEELNIVNRSAEFDMTASLQIPAERLTSAPAPNPCRETTHISINVPATFRDAGTQGTALNKYPGTPTRAAQLQETIPTWVTVTVYNVLGQKIKDLYKGRLYPTVHTVVWNADNNNGERIHSGLYFFKIEAGPYTEVQKIMVLR